MSPGPLVVIGDSLLDIDLDGRSDRLAPDAPVPVVDLDRCSGRPGGAGLAALLSARAGAPVVLVTAIGRDDGGDALLGLLGTELTVAAQPLRGRTVVKSRIRAAKAPVVRLDRGDGVGGGAPLTDQAADAIRGAGAVLVSDYGRGMAWQHEVRRLLAERPAAVPVVWDPHPRGARPVEGCTALTPSVAEAARLAAGAPDEHARGLDLLQRWEAQAVAVTAAEDGAYLTTGTPASTAHFSVPDDLAVRDGAGADTCGAGDRFAGALTDRLRLGVPLAEAVPAAVEGATRYVLAGGAGSCSVPVGAALGLPAAVAPDADLTTLLHRTRRAGGRVVATGGCFDLLHRGHVDLLERARALGDLLVVCLNSDASVRRAKGRSRPYVDQQDRARVLRSLASVDAVVIFDEDTPAELLEWLRPDIWVKGCDYTGQSLPEADTVARHGGRVALLPLVDGYSSSRLAAAAGTSRRPRVGLSR